MFCLERLKRAKGIYTDAQVSRCSELAGQFGDVIDDLLSQKLACRREGHYSCTKHVSDVKKFIEDTKDESLWQIVPNRHHVGFEKMEHVWRIDKCRKVFDKLKHLRARRDRWKECF